MKLLVCMLVCWLWSACARAGDEVLPDVCSSRFGSSVPAAAQVDKLRQPVALAIATLDNAQIVLPSPSLASGTVAYVSITPNFAERVDQTCVLGYFELRRGGVVMAMPLVVESLEVVKKPHWHNHTQIVESTRIYFRVPAVEDFHGEADALENWRFWDRHQSLHLKIAAFDYAGGTRGRPYFGRDQPITVSDKGASIVAAWLFAIIFYAIAAIAVPAATVSNSGGAPLSWRRRAERLLPWNITGATGQTSLSQLQMLVFTLIVATLLFYQWLRTGLLQEISTDLLYLIGISTAGTAATQVATTVRKDLDPAVYQYVQRLGWFTAPVPAPRRKASAKGMLMTNGRFDIYKFQMLVFTTIIAAYVVASGADELGNIKISAALLTLMGMSQGAYVGGRVAVDALTPLQDQLRGMQDLQQRFEACQDPVVRQVLRGRFRAAAELAGAMFTTMFGRVLPAYMLDMPLDACSLAAGTETMATE